MLSAFANCFKIPELRSRILFTLAMVVIVRLGAVIPCPGINSAILGEYFKNAQTQNGLIGLFNLFTGGALENCALFSLSIMPYISASIMMQLVTAVIPSMSKMAREDGGRQKITQYTRYATIALCLVQGYLFTKGFAHPETNPFLPGIDQIINKMGHPLVENPGLMFYITTIITLTTGTMLLMWLGEQITDKGIGNGISMVITVGIVARIPSALGQAWTKLVPPPGSTAEPMNPLLLVIMLLFLFGVIAATIAITQAVRKIPVQYAKQIRGNKVYGGQAQFLPLKVNYAGVMPIIFAQSILLFPPMIIAQLFPFSSVARSIVDNLHEGWIYYSLYSAMILFFSYFWVTTQFNPTQIADDLQKHNGLIPGIRPGRDTANYLDQTMNRLTLAGAVFLTVLAILPMVVQRDLEIPQMTAQFFGGTSLLIVVGVMLDTMRQMETYLLQRHYSGFLRKGRIRSRATGAVGAQSQAVDHHPGLIYLYIGIALLILAGVTISVLQHG